MRTLFEIPSRKSDVVYTPDYVAKDIIDWLKPSGICLDPCYGDGAFYKHFPIGSCYCELSEGTDFFEFHTSVDWIIGNPPYSIFEEWLRHSFELAPEVCYLLPTNKVFQRQVIMSLINRFGGIKGMKIYGSGTSIGFPFGFSVGAFHFSKNYRGGGQAWN